VEDVAYRVIAAHQKPDHATIARFRARHEDALAGLFQLGAGVVQAGGAGEGRGDRDRRNEGPRERVASLERRLRAARTGDPEGGREGRRRGGRALRGRARDELPEHLRTSEGRRAALRDAKRKLDQDRAEQQNGSATTEAGDGAEAPGVKVELDSELIVARVQGRDGWLLEARRQLDEHRRREARPIPRSRAERLLEAERRLRQDLRSSAKRTMPMSTTGDRARQARPTAQSPAEAIRAARGAGGEDQHDGPGLAEREDPRSYTQGYNAQAVVNEHQIVLAAR